MAKSSEPYQMVLVESYIPSAKSGLHGKVHIRPVAGQLGIPEGLHVECSKSLTSDFPVGTKFRVKAKLTDREGRGEYLYSNFRWPVEVIG